MAQRLPGRFIGAFAALALFLPLVTTAGCKLFNKEKKQFGEDCQSDEDCDTLECATYGSVCTKPCTYDRECGSGFVCRARDGRPGDACAKPTGLPNGQNCNNAAECQSGNCLKPAGDPNAVGFCSLHCETEADCPENYKMCISISDSGQTKFCIPGGGTATNIPGTEPPKFVAPRPVPKLPTTVTVTTTTTTTPPATTTTTTKPSGTPLGPTATASTTAPATTTSSTTTPPATTSTSTTKPAGTTTTTKRPPVIKFNKK